MGEIIPIRTMTPQLEEKLVAYSVNNNFGPPQYGRSSGAISLFPLEHSTLLSQKVVLVVGTRIYVRTPF